MSSDTKLSSERHSLRFWRPGDPKEVEPRRGRRSREWLNQRRVFVAVSARLCLQLIVTIAALSWSWHA
jgi:hypothetical protein